MNIIKKLFSLIYKPFNHNPEDFQLKIVPSWFSDDYISFKYTANGGKNWKYIYCAKSPFLELLEYDWEWEILTYSLGTGEFTDEKAQFSSYQKILDYEANELIKFNEGTDSIIRQRKELEIKKQKAYKRANIN